MSVIEITNRDDLRVGDTATFTYRDRDDVEHEFTGPLWTDSGGLLYVGDARVRGANGHWFAPHEFVRATREITGWRPAKVVPV